MAILTTCTSTFVDLNEINIGDVAPSSPSNNELWFDTTNNIVYKWDDSLKQWIVVNDYTEEIKNAIDGIEVNSRNLLYDTAAAIDIVTNSTETKTVKLHDLVNSLNYTKHIKGNKITFAFDWEYIGTTPTGSFYIQTNGPQYSKLSNQINVSNTNYYGTESLTVNLTSDSTFTNTSIVCTHNNGTIRIMHCRMLFGDKDLGWTQAPEDLVSKFETIFDRTAKGIYMQASGNGQTSLVNVDNQEVKIKSNNINIEGYTTINQHFKILPSGDLEAVNAKFSGTVDAFNISGATITGSVLTTGANFNVNSSGVLTAKNGNFSGNISASSITGGSITGTTFTSTNSKFKVLADGTIEATNGNFTGNINTGSNITGAAIVGSSIRNASSTFTVSSEGIITGASLKGGTIGIGNGTSYDAFTVDTNGNVNIKKGSINLGSGAFTVDNNGRVIANNLKITGGDMSIGNGNFIVSNSGDFTAKNATITGNITITGGSVPDSVLSNNITTGAANGISALDKIIKLEVGGVNLLVQKNITKTKYLNSANVVTSDAAWFYTDYISVKGVKNIRISGFTNLGQSPATCFYDSSNTFISGISNGNSGNVSTVINNCELMNVPSNAAYMRCSGMISDLPTLKIEKGTIATSYSPSPVDVDSNINDVSTSLGTLGSSIKSAFGDGIINDSEAKAIASNIQILTNEKSDIDREYSTIYSNVKLAGTTKTNLLSAKTAYDSAHASLISSINTAISDKIIANAERTSVDSFFTTYRSKLADYKQRVQEALDYISTKKVDDIEIGGRNLYSNKTTKIEILSSKGSYERGTSIAGAENGFKLTVNNSLHARVRCVTEGVSDYTISFYIKSSVNATVFMDLNDLSQRAISVTPSYQKVIHTVGNTKAYDATYNFIDFESADASGTVFYIKDFMVETGNKASSWTPALEETLVSVVTMYYLSTSSTSQTGGSWITTLPATTANKFIWQKTVTTYAAGDTSETTPILYQPDWIQDWGGTQTTIGGTSVLSPKIFAGTKDSNGAATGIAMGANVLGSGTDFSGLAGYQNGVKTYHFKTDGSFLIGKNTSGSNISWDGTNLNVKASSISIGATSVATSTDLSNAVNQGSLYVKGSGMNRPTSRVVKLNDITIAETDLRGLTLIVIKRSDLTISKNQNYDVYGSDTSKTELADTLNALDDSNIVVLTSYDAIATNDVLDNAIARCGGSGTRFGGSFHRVPYALVGIPGIGKGTGLEMFTNVNVTDSYAEIYTKIINGIPQGINTTFREVYSSITPTAIVNSINTRMAEGGLLDTVSTTLDKNGFTVKNGAITIKNKANATVLTGDTNGNLTLSGNITSTANITGGTITGATIKNATNTFSVSADGAVVGASISGGTITGASISTTNGAFSVSNTGELRATGAVITGTITAGAGSNVASTYLTGIIDNARLNSTITTGATNGTAAQATLNSKASGWDSTKNTMDSNSTNWINAYNRVVQWAYGAVSGSTTINGGLIQTNTILANKIAIGDFNNYCELNPTNCTSYGFTKVADAAASNNPWLQLNTLARDNSLCSANSYEVYTGNVVGPYRIEFEVSSNVTGATTSGGAGGTYMGISVGLYCKTNIGGNAWYLSNVATSSSAATATKISSVVNLPSNIVSFGIYLQIGGYAPFAGTCKIRNIRVTKMMTGELIVDGAIDGQTITGATLRGGTIGIGGTAYDAFTVDSAGNVAIKKGSIDINNGAFSVNDKGVLTATSANITGNINSGSTITGATIKNATNTFSVSPNGVITGASINASAISTTSGNFSVNNSGILYAKGAVISGNVTIVSGSVPDDVLSSTITSGAANGSNALTGLNNLDIGGRNLLVGSSDEFINYSTSQYYALVGNQMSLEDTGLKNGDEVIFRVYLKPTTDKGARTRISYFYGDGTNYRTILGNVIKLGTEGYSEVKTTLTDVSGKIWCGINSDDTSTTTSAIGEYKKPKFEKGNKATEWTPAPEDFLNSIAESEKAINDNIDSAIGTIKEDVLQSVGDNYAPLDDFKILNQSVSSKFAQTAKDISATFTTVNNYAKTVDGKLQDFQDTVDSYIKFSANGIDLGKTNNPFTATLDNTKLAFKQDGEVVAYVSNNKMFITTADIDDQLRIGDPTNGYFVWTQGGKGNLTLKWSDK